MPSTESPLSRFYHPAIRSKLVQKKPVALEICGEKIVFFRDSKGEIVSLEDKCPHRFTPLSQGKVHGDQVVCPYHGWKVNHDRVDHPVSGKIANCRVKSYFSYESHGYVWVASEVSAVQPSMSSDDWFQLGAYEIEIAAPLHVVFDNFSEDEHFPYVHKILGWNAAGAKKVQFEFEASRDELHVHYRGPQRTFPGMSLFMAKPGDHFDNRWITRFDPVRTTYTAAMTDEVGIRSNSVQQRVAVFFVPISEGLTKLHVFQYAKFDDPKWNFIFRFTARLTCAITKWDLCFDRDFVEKIGAIPYELKGMRLGKYDQPIFHGRQRLDSIYYARSQSLLGQKPPAELDVAGHIPVEPSFLS